MDSNIIENKENLSSLASAAPIEKAKAIFDVLYSKKARNIKVYDAVGKTEITDYVIVASGTSSTHIKALANEVEYSIKLRNLDPDNFEGRDNNAWIVLDYGSVMVHIMSRETREFYDLEKLFAGAAQLDFAPKSENINND